MMKEQIRTVGQTELLANAELLTGQTDVLSVEERAAYLVQRCVLQSPALEQKVEAEQFVECEADEREDGEQQDEPLFGPEFS